MKLPEQVCPKETPKYRKCVKQLARRQMRRNKLKKIVYRGYSK